MRPRVIVIDVETVVLTHSDDGGVDLTSRGGGTVADLPVGLREVVHQLLVSGQEGAITLHQKPDQRIDDVEEATMHVVLGPHCRIGVGLVVPA